MHCPFCSCEETTVKDSRPTDDGAIRRRRACPSCNERFTTYERVQMRELTVLKADGRTQPFDRDKIVRSMQVALRKRPVALPAIEKAAGGIVHTLESVGEAEVTSERIGAEVMKALAGLDSVGFIRYASVYKDFRQPDDFNAFLEEFKKLQATSIRRSKVA